MNNDTPIAQGGRGALRLPSSSRLEGVGRPSVKMLGGSAGGRVRDTRQKGKETPGRRRAEPPTFPERSAN